MSKGKFYAGDFRLGYCAFCKHWYDPLYEVCGGEDQGASYL